jgi:hypothetical protein
VIIAIISNKSLKLLCCFYTVGDVQPKWFHLGAYETNAEALRSRKIIKNIVINDSNGTIQIDPVVNFYEIFNSLGAGSKNNGGFFINFCSLLCYY